VPGWGLDESSVEAEAAKDLLLSPTLPCHEQISDDFSDFSSIIKILSKNYPIIYKNLNLHFRCGVAKWSSG
jgi:hypothetical protein